MSGFAKSREAETKNGIYATIDIMKKIYITTNSKQTRKLGKLLAEALRGGPARNASRSDAGGEIICLTGDLGSGKTTFAQGILEGLGAKGPYTSPTFVVMKHYHTTHNTQHITQQKERSKKKLRVMSYVLRDIYHIDAYRVGPKDILDLGWEEIVAGENNVVIVEWAERIRRIIPKKTVWIRFEHVGKDKRRIVVGSKVESSGSGY